MRAVVISIANQGGRVNGVGVVKGGEGGGDWKGEERMRIGGLEILVQTTRNVGEGGLQASYTFPLRITCKKKKTEKRGGGGPDSM